MALGIKNLPAMQETEEMWFQFLCGEDSLEESMAIHSSILARRIPWIEAGGLKVHRVAKSQKRLKRLSTNACIHKDISQKVNK